MINHKVKLIVLIAIILALPIVILAAKQRQETRSSAAAPDQLEAEGGVLGGNASIQTDTQASGGQYVLFQAQASSPTYFIKQTNGFLSENGNPVKFAGANLYWLGLSESGGVHYPSHFEIEDAVLTVKEMGGNVIRSFGAMTVGCSLCIEPTLNNFNPNAFDSLDYAVKAAKDNNIRLILPLVDNYKYYHGGKYTFLSWRGIADDSNGDFFTNPTVINDFKSYISYVLNHVNTYTGLAYKDDPTIMVWETGNEVYPGSSCCSSTSVWAKTIANYIKSIAPNQLVADGHYGLDSGSYATTSIDILSDHYSSPSSKLATNQTNAKAKGKVFMLGEHHWTQLKASGAPAETYDLQTYLSAVEANNVGISIYWSLFPHKEIPDNSSHGFVQHGDGYTLHYPGDTADMISRAQILRTFAYKVAQGKTAPAHKTPDAPLLYTPTVSSSKVIVNWRGIVAAASYSLERSLDQTNWTVVSSTITDNNAPYTDSSAPIGKIYYRIVGKNLDGVKGAYSNVVNMTH